MPNLFCQNCGAKLSEGQVFCGKCGHKNEVIQPVVEEPVVEEPVVEEVKVVAPTCANCGAPLQEGQKFCPNCGKLTSGEEVKEKFFCANCGKEMSPEQTFCTGCGSVKGQKMEQPVVQNVVPGYKMIRAAEGERSTSHLTEILHKVFKFSGLGLFLLGMLLLLFYPVNKHGDYASILTIIFDSFENFDSAIEVEFYVYMSVFILIIFTVLIIVMNISFVTGLFGMNKIKREKFWVNFITSITVDLFIFWYALSMDTLIGTKTPVTIYLVCSILLHLLYITLYIIKLLKGEFGGYTFKFKRTGKLLASRIVHLCAIVVIFLAYSFVIGSSFLYKEYEMSMFDGIKSLKDVNLFAFYFDVDNPVLSIEYMFSYICTFFKLMIETALIGGFLMGVYRIIVADETDDASVGGFYGIVGKKLILGLALLAMFKVEIKYYYITGDIFDVYLDILKDSYLKIMLPIVAVLAVAVAGSITHVVIHNKWLRENNYK